MARGAGVPTAATAATLAVVATLAAACGELDAQRGLKRVRPGAVPSGEIARYGRTSPERALLVWLSAVQTGAASAVAGGYDPTLRVTPAEVRRQRAAARKLFARLGFPEIRRVERRGDRATVFCFLSSRRRAANGRLYVYETPQAFELRRVGGTWRLADDLFLRFARTRYLPAEPA